MKGWKGLYLGASLAVAGGALVLAYLRFASGDPPAAIFFLGLTVVLVGLRAGVHRHWRGETPAREIGPRA